MGDRGSNPHSLAAEFARSDAREIQSRYPYFFDVLRVPVPDLAKALGLRIEERADLAQRAQLEVFTKGSEQESTIIVKSGLNQGVRRFAIAHEIGHFVLMQRRPHLSRSWSTLLRETFANRFAAELLLSPEGRGRMEDSFRDLSDPLELLRLASDVGLSPQALLTQAQARRPLTSGLSKIWLRVKYTENAVTHAEPRLRIISAYYDRDQFYIPENQSLTRFAGEDGWLSSLPVGISFRQASMVSIQLKRPPDAVPKYRRTTLRADISAVRLSQSPTSERPIFILLTEVGRPTAPCVGA